MRLRGPDGKQQRQRLISALALGEGFGVWARGLPSALDMNQHDLATNPERLKPFGLRFKTNALNDIFNVVR